MASKELEGTSSMVFFVCSSIARQVEVQVVEARHAKCMSMLISFYLGGGGGWWCVVGVDCG